MKVATKIWPPKIVGNFLLAEESVASEEELCSVAGVRFFVSKHIFIDVQTTKTTIYLQFDRLHNYIKHNNYE